MHWIKVFCTLGSKVPKHQMAPWVFMAVCLTPCSKLSLGTLLGKLVFRFRKNAWNMLEACTVGDIQESRIVYFMNISMPPVVCFCLDVICFRIIVIKLSLSNVLSHVSKNMSCYNHLGLIQTHNLHLQILDKPIINKWNFFKRKS